MIQLKTTKSIWNYLLISLIVISFWLIFDSVNGLDYINWLRVLCLCTIICTIINFIIILTNGHSIVGPLSIFLILLYAFHFGQVVNTAVNPSYVSASTNFVAKEFAKVKESLSFSFINIQIIGMFSILMYENVFRKCEKKYHVKSSDHFTFRCTGIALFAISFPLRAYIDITRMITMHTSSNYMKVAQLNFSGMISVPSEMFVVAIIMLLISFKNRKIVARCIFLFACLWLLFSMASGSRMYAAISVYMILFIYLKCVEHFKVRNIVFLLIFALIGLEFLQMVSKIRLEGVSVRTISNYIKSSNHNNTIVSTLDEFGSTIFSVIEAFREIPSKMSFHKGLSYIQALAWVLPNAGGFLDKLHSQVYYTMRFHHKYTYGGSVIGELYYNFGYAAFIFAPLIGGFVGSIAAKLDGAIKCKDYWQMCFYIMPVVGMLIWIRDYFSVLVRGTVWTGMVLIFLKYIFSKIYNIWIIREKF